MTGPLPYPDSDTGAEPDGASSQAAPRWVPVVGIAIAIGLLLLIVVLHLTGTVGPGAH